jgi:hypothetical protein
MTRTVPGRTLSIIVVSWSSDVTRLCDGAAAPNKNTRRVGETAEQATGSPSVGRFHGVQLDPSVERKINPLVSAGSSMNLVPVQTRLHQVAVFAAGSVLKCPGRQIGARHVAIADALDREIL